MILWEFVSPTVMMSENIPAAASFLFVCSLLIRFCLTRHRAQYSKPAAKALAIIHLLGFFFVLVHFVLHAVKAFPKKRV